MKDNRTIAVDIGGVEIATVGFDGTELVVTNDAVSEEGGQEWRFTAEQDKECAIFVADTYCTADFFDELKPDRIRIELHKDGEREDLSTFEIYHDEFAEFCVRNEGKTEKIERRLRQLYEEGNRFCRTTFLIYLRELQRDSK